MVHNLLKRTRHNSATFYVCVLRFHGVASELRGTEEKREAYFTTPFVASSCRGSSGCKILNLKTTILCFLQGVFLHKQNAMEEVQNSLRRLKVLVEAVSSK